MTTDFDWAAAEAQMSPSAHGLAQMVGMPRGPRHHGLHIVARLGDDGWVCGCCGTWVPFGVEHQLHGGDPA